MPDVYTDAPVWGTGGFPTSPGTTTIQQPDSTIPSTELPFGDGTGASLSEHDKLLSEFGGVFNDSGSQVLSSKWARSEDVTQPITTFPVKSALRFLKNYNPNVGVDLSDPNLENKYGDEQSFWEKGLYRMLKTGATAGVAFAGGIADLVDLPLGIDPVTDPDITRANSWLSRLDSEDLPNFETTYQRDHPVASWINPLHFTSFLDNYGKVVQNIGYTIGAIGSAVVTDIPLGLVGGALGGAPILAEGGLVARQAERIFEGIGKLARVITSSDEEYNAYKGILREGDDVLKALTRASNITKGSDAARFVSGVAISSFGEGVMEANNNYTDTKNQLLATKSDEYGNFIGTDKEKAQIEELSKSAGHDTLWPNVAFLAVSNMLGYSAFLKPATAAARATEEALAKEVSMRVSRINPNTIDTITKPLSRIETILKRFSNPQSLISDNLREGVEEGVQFVISQSSKDYYSRQFEPDANNEANTYADSISRGLSDVFGTRAGIENVVFGFLGGIFQHGARHIFQRAQGFHPLEGSALATQIQGKLAAGGNVTGLFTTNRAEAVVNSSVSQDMEKALETGDIFAYKNLRHTALFNFVSSAADAHKFDLRIDQLNALKQLDKDNFETLFGMSLNDTNKKTVGEYIDAVVEKAKDMKNDIDKVNTVFGTNPYNSKEDPKGHFLFEQYKKELAHSISLQKDYRRRAADIKEEVLSKIPGAAIEDITTLTDPEGVNFAVSKFEKKIADLKQSEVNAAGNEDLQKGFKEQREFLEQKVADLKDSADNLDSYQYVRTSNELFNYFANGYNIHGDLSVDQTDTKDLLDKTADLHKLNFNTKRIRNYYNILSGKAGFENFAGDLSRMIDNYEDRVRFDENGKMRILTDEELKAENAQADPKTARPVDKTYVNNTLGVKTVEEGETKIEAEDKKLIAKLIDPTDEKEEGETESEGDKIRNGKIAITPELKERAKARLKEEFTAPAEEDEVPKQEDGKTKAEKRAERVKKEMEDQGVSVPTDEGADINDIMEKDLAAKKASPLEALSSLTPENPAQTFWDKYIFQPLKMFNRMLSQSFDDVDYKGNLEKLLISANTPLGFNEKVIRSLRAEITKSVKGMKPNERRRLTYDYEKVNPDKTKTILKAPFKNLYTKGYSTDVTVYSGDSPIGILQMPTRMEFKRGEEFFTLDQLADAAEYAEVTRNSPETFEQFKKEFGAYKAAYDELVKEFDGTKALSINNDKLLSIFRPEVLIGNIPYTKQGARSTQINKLKYRGQGDAILSFPVELNEATGKYERTTKPAILNSEQLSDQQLLETMAFVSDNMDRIHKLNVRYIYIMRLPNGALDKMSIIAARPVDESAANLTDYHQELKDALTNTEDTVSSINEKLGNLAYITHLKPGSKDENRVTHSRFSISKTEPRKLVLNIFNAGAGVSEKINFTKEEVMGTKDFDSFLALVNQRIQETEKKRRFSTIELTLTPQSFKKSIVNDESASVEDLEENLAVSVRPQVFANGSITFMPLSVAATTGQAVVNRTATPEEAENFSTPNVQVPEEAPKEGVHFKNVPVTYRGVPYIVMFKNEQVLRIVKAEGGKADVSVQEAADIINLAAGNVTAKDVEFADGDTTVGDPTVVTPSTSDPELDKAKEEVRTRWYAELNPAAPSLTTIKNDLSQMDVPELRGVLRQLKAKQAAPNTDGVDLLADSREADINKLQSYIDAKLNAYRNKDEINRKYDAEMATVDPTYSPQYTAAPAPDVVNENLNNIINQLKSKGIIETIC